MKNVRFNCKEFLFVFFLRDNKNIRFVVKNNEFLYILLMVVYKEF